MDHYYLQLLMWMSSLTDGDVAAAVVYGIISGGLVTGAYAWLVYQRRHDRAAQLRTAPFRYFRLRLGR